MWEKLSAYSVLVLLASLLFSCSSNRDSGGDQTGPGITLADAETRGITNCLTCHAPSSTVGTGWQSSRHANNLAAAAKRLQDEREVPEDDPDPDYPFPSTICVPCHDQFGDGMLLADADPTLTNRPVISCESCHGGGQFHNGIAAGIPFALPGPDQCGECHGLDGVELFHRASESGNNVRRNISDTHYDDPATGDIEGYNVRANEQSGCVDCHYSAHSFDLNINLDWARAGHAGEIKDLKDEELFAQLDEAAAAADLLAAVKAEAVTDTPDGLSAWAHYNFATLFGGACTRCHTSTGAKNYLDDPAAYTPAMNDFSYLAGEQRELLYCWGCHSDSRGTLRDPGAITADYTDAPFTYEDLDASNVCMACHIGRESGDTIKNSTDDFSDKSFVNSHYLAAGGTLFGVTGYEFDGVSYDNPDYRHDVVGTEDSADGAGNAVDTGDGGPCVECHMTSVNPADATDDDSHTFEPIVKDDSGVITDITTTVCDACHLALAPADLIAESDGYAAALEALRVALEAEGYTYSTSYPYFSATDWTAAGDATGKNDMGAAFNYNLLIHDPGGYSHNRFYSKRLIFDSLDWLDNRVLDGTIDLSAAPDAAAYLNADAPVGAVTRPEP